MDRRICERVGDGRFLYTCGDRIERQLAGVLTSVAMTEVMEMMTKNRPRHEVAARMQKALIERHKSIEVYNMWESPYKLNTVWPVCFTTMIMDDDAMILNLFLKSLGRSKPAWVDGYATYIYDEQKTSDTTSKIRNLCGSSIDAKFSSSDRACIACNLKDIVPAKNAKNSHSGGTIGSLTEDVVLNPRNAATLLMALIGLHLCTKCLDSWMTVVVNKDGLNKLLLSMGNLPSKAKMCIIESLREKCVSTKFVEPVYPTAAEPIGQYGKGGMARVASYVPLYAFLYEWLTYTEVAPLDAGKSSTRTRSHRSATEGNAYTKKMENAFKAFFEGPELVEPFNERRTHPIPNFTVPVAGDPNLREKSYEALKKFFDSGCPRVEAERPPVESFPMSIPNRAAPVSTVVVAAADEIKFSAADKVKLLGFHPIPSSAHGQLEVLRNRKHKRQTSPEQLGSASHDQISERKMSKQARHVTPPCAVPPSVCLWSSPCPSEYGDVLPCGTRSSPNVDSSMYADTPHHDVPSDGVTPLSESHDADRGLLEFNTDGWRPDLWDKPSRSASPTPACTDDVERLEMGSTTVYDYVVQADPSRHTSPSEKPCYAGSDSEFDITAVDAGVMYDLSELPWFPGCEGKGAMDGPAVTVMLP